MKHLFIYKILILFLISISYSLAEDDNNPSIIQLNQFRAGNVAPNITNAKKSSSALETTPTEFEIARFRQRIKPFLGTYVSNYMISEYPYPDYAIIDVQDNRPVYQWTGNGLLMGNDLPLRDSTTNVRKSHHNGSLSGLVQQETKVRFENNSYIVEITETGKKGKMHEIRKFSLTGNQLDYSLKRDFFVKKWGYFGPWIPDTESTYAKMNLRDIKEIYYKTSPVPWTYEVIKKVLSSRPNFFKTIDRGNNPTQEFRMINPQQLEKVTEATEIPEEVKSKPKASAEIISFKERTTNPPSEERLEALRKSPPANSPNLAKLQCLQRKISVIEGE